MPNITEAIPVLRAARLVFERAGNKALVLSTDELIREVQEEVRLEAKAKRREESIRRAECGCYAHQTGFHTLRCAEAMACPCGDEDLPSCRECQEKICPAHVAPGTLQEHDYDRESEDGTEAVHTEDVICLSCMRDQTEGEAIIRSYISSAEPTEGAK